MNEYDSLVTQLQVVKSKLVTMDKCSELIPINSDTYDYLVSHILYSSFNKDKFVERVKELYSESVKLGMEPDLYDLEETIDSENMIIISTFYKGLGYDNNDVEDVLAHYCHDISPMLGDWIEDILTAENYQFKGISLMKLFTQKHRLVDSEGQNIVNPEWL